MRHSQPYVLRVDQSRISALWPMMRDNLLKSLPLHQQTAQIATNVLYSLTMGQSQLWIGLEHREDDTWHLYGYVLTSIVNDTFTGARNLLIHMAISLNDSSAFPELYRTGLKQLDEFAKANKCGCIIGITKNGGLANMMREVAGADISQCLFSIPVGGNTNGV